MSYPSRQADDEVLVTSAMVEAGVAVLDYEVIQDLWDGGAGVTRQSVVEEVFRAMLRAAPSKP